MNGFGAIIIAKLPRELTRFIFDQLAMRVTVATICIHNRHLLLSLSPKAHTLACHGRWRSCYMRSRWLYISTTTIWQFSM